MSTFITPGALADLSFNEYMKLLEKDFARKGRAAKQEDYVVFTDYKFGTKKACLLLFVDTADKDWENALAAARKNSKKEASGKCLVTLSKDQDGNGKDDIVISIKTAEGDLDKKKVAATIKEDLFPKDIDVSVNVFGVSIHEGDPVPNISTAAQDLDEVASELENEEADNSFIRKLKELMAHIGSAQKMQTNVQTFLKDLKTIAAKPVDEDQKVELANEILAFNEFLNEHLPVFEDILDKGDRWLTKHKGKRFTLIESDDHKAQVQEVEEDMILLKRLNRLLIQAQDYNQTTYIQGNTTYDELSTLDIYYTRIDEKWESYSKLNIDSFSEDVFKFNRELKGYIDYIVNANPKIRKRIDIRPYNDKLKKLVSDALLLDSLRLKDIEKKHKLDGFTLEFKAYSDIALSDDINDMRNCVKILTNFRDRLVDAYAKSTVLQVETQPLYFRILDYLTVSKQRMKATKATQLDKMLLEADKKGGRTADNLFDVFMETYRGVVKYTPEEGGTIYDGCINANCQDFCTALGELFRAAGFNNIDTTVVIATYFMTLPVDDRWIDPSSKGNIEVIGSNTRQWYFAAHWVVSVDGSNYCVITGRKKAEIPGTVVFESGGKLNEEPVDGLKKKVINGYEFTEFSKRDSRGYFYSLKAV